jgi:hypothetical protein
MRLEAVTVCVNYADYLEQTLPFTLQHVDDVVVVTIPEDRRTVGLCHKMGVRCLATRCFYQWGDTFNKARGINYGLANLRLDGWVVHLDADIVLPHRARWLLDVVELDPRKLYGCDRVNVVGREVWEEAKSQLPQQYVSSCRIEPPTRHEWGSRLIHVGYAGYMPIGYFQLWNPAGSGVDRYPDTAAQQSAEHTDVLHAMQWARRDRELLPEIIAMHLVTKGGQASMGTNWLGRKSPEFSRDEGPYRGAATAERHPRPHPHPHPHPHPPHPHPPSPYGVPCWDEDGS